MFNGDNYKDVIINRTISEISAETIIKNIKKDWVIDGSDKMFKYTKEELEKFIFFMLRNLPCLSITCIEYIVDNKRIVEIVGDENKLVALVLFINGVFPTKQCTIKEILNDLDKREILKEAEFQVELKGSIMDLTYNKLPENVKSMFMRKEIPVILVNVQYGNEESIKDIKEILKK